MDEREREAILSAAREQGLAAEDMARQVLKDWLEQKPDPQLLSLWKDYVGHIWNHFTDDEQLQMRQNLLTAAEEVANAAGGFLGLSKISTAEQEVIEDLRRVFNNGSPPESPENLHDSGFQSTYSGGGGSRVQPARLRGNGCLDLGACFG